MDWDRRRYARASGPRTVFTDVSHRFDDRRGGESYRPVDRSGRSPSRGFDGRRRSPPRNRSRPRADTWVPTDRGYGRLRSRSPANYRRRSRTPPFQGRGYGPGPYSRRRSPPRRFSPRRDDRVRSPPSWRSRSPQSETRSRDPSKGRSSPTRTREGTPGSQIHRVIRRPSPTAPGNDRATRATSPRTSLSNTFRSQSPSSDYRREQPADSSRPGPLSRTRRASPVHALPSEPSEAARRSSPTPNSGRRGQVPMPLRSRSRSPMRHSSPRPPSKPLGRSPYHVSNYEQEHAAHAKAQEDAGHFLAKGSSERSQTGGGRLGGNVPTQPRNLGMGQSPPLGPSQGPKAAPLQRRASYNMSLLSAPTRPRRGPGPRDGPWTGSPIARRGPVITASPSVPSGPRAPFTPPVPVGGTHRHNSRQSVATPAGPSPAPRGPNHLAGLGAVIPGGRILPSILDAAIEKRLTQLDTDREKLLDQVAETQRSKRAGLRDWDRLDRESSICALKSELAEGHLQRMADESMGGGVLF